MRRRDFYKYLSGLVIFPFMLIAKKRKPDLRKEDLVKLAKELPNPNNCNDILVSCMSRTHHYPVGVAGKNLRKGQLVQLTENYTVRPLDDGELFGIVLSVENKNLVKVLI